MYFHAIGSAVCTLYIFFLVSYFFCLHYEDGHSEITDKEIGLFFKFRVESDASHDGCAWLKGIMLYTLSVVLK